MADFKPFGAAVNKKLQQLAQNELFVTINGDTLYEIYLASFPPGTNPMFRTKTEHDCQCCRNFIRNYGNVVALTREGLQSVWNVTGLEEPYQTVATAMNKAVTEHAITNLFRTEEKRYGAEATKMATETGPFTWNHFWGDVALQHYTKTPDKARGDYRSAVDVFQRTLDTIGDEHVQTVLGLIKDNNLYRGEEHRDVLTLYSAAKRSYDKSGDKNRFVWIKLNKRLAGFKNSVIGTLVEDLAKGVPLDDAVRMFEAKVAPSNYKRPKALVTPAMVAAAQKTIDDLGLSESLARRTAVLSDVSVNNVLWVNNTAAAKMKDGLAGLLGNAVKQTQTEAKAEAISIADFLTLLPKVRDIELMVPNSQINKLMTLTTAKHGSAPSLFNWSNPFGWSYNGAVTDSIKERVKAAGGNITADLRVSLSWQNTDDLDLHVVTPDGEHIGFMRKMGRTGHLDVDMNAGIGISTSPVENVAFIKPTDGNYGVRVNQYSRRNSADYGFTLEIEYKGVVSSYSYDDLMSSNETKHLSFNLNKGSLTVTTMDAGLKGGPLSMVKDMWGIQTHTWTKVQTVMHSPNYWDGNAIGNRHTFFLLEGCVNPEPVRGLYNEFLRSDLNEYGRVFELLGAKTMCESVADTLSGVGYSSTNKDVVTVRVSGDKLQKTLNINF